MTDHDHRRRRPLDKVERKILSAVMVVVFTLGVMGEAAVGNYWGLAGYACCVLVFAVFLVWD